MNAGRQLCKHVISLLGLPKHASYISLHNGFHQFSNIKAESGRDTEHYTQIYNLI